MTPQQLNEMEIGAAHRFADAVHPPTRRATQLAPGFYTGPCELWRRFKAGFTVTQDNWLMDGSPWIVTGATRYDLARFTQMIGVVSE